MAKLGSEKRPVIVRVKTQERAHAVTAACAERGWHCIAGVEPDRTEDISDFERLMSPVTPARSGKVGRNEPCPCGSGRKFKRCCANQGEGGQEEEGPGAGRFRYEPGSYGGQMTGYMPSIVCYQRSGPDAWREHFCLVNPDADLDDDAETASIRAHEHLAAALARGADGSAESFAMYLKDAGYVRLSDFRMAADN